MSSDVRVDKTYCRPHFSACDRTTCLAKGLVPCLERWEVSILGDAPNSPEHSPKQPAAAAGAQLSQKWRWGRMDTPSEREE